MANSFEPWGARLEERRAGRGVSWPTAIGRSVRDGFAPTTRNSGHPGRAAKCLRIHRPACWLARLALKDATALRAHRTSSELRTQPDVQAMSTAASRKYSEVEWTPPHLGRGTNAKNECFYRSVRGECVNWRARGGHRGLTATELHRASLLSGAPNWDATHK